MKYYCITGGIGAGKSFVCRLLEQHGIDIYDCDSGAKRIMNSDPGIMQALTSLIGSNTYKDGTLNKPVVAQFLLASEANKQAVNAIVHPAVMQDFRHSGKQWMESAILHEAHLEQYVDKVVAVTAPEETRIQRVMKRDGIDYVKAKEWVDKQFPQEEVARRSDYVIVNDGKANLEEQITNLLSQINEADS